METNVKTFKLPMKNKLGWKFPDAVLAIWEAHMDSTSSLIATSCDEPYKKSRTDKGIVYKANWWPSQEALDEGLPSVPLYDTTSEDPIRLEVDAEHEETINSIMDGSLPADDRALSAIKADIIRRVS
jgi:hypothetical protein